MISDLDIQRIKEAAKLDDIITKFGITLKKAGINFKACCPFHTEDTPSFVVRKPGTTRPYWTWHCYGCGKNGNPISFLQELNGWSFSESCKWIANEYGIEIEEKERTPEEKKKDELRESMLHALTNAQEFFINKREEDEKNSGTASEYLKSRKISKATLDKFGVGVSGKKDELTDKLVNGLKYSKETVISAGLSYENGYNHSIDDSFRYRITFPFYDIFGKVIGFTGRTLYTKEELSEFKGKDIHIAKYSNTLETLVFHKGDQFYGLYQAIEAIQRENKVICVEGQFDVLSCYDNGLKNVVAFSGSSLTDHQQKLIQRYTHNIVLMFDADKTGVASTLKYIPELIKAGFKVSCCRIPSGKDADEWAHSVKNFNLQVSKNTCTFVEYMVHALNLIDEEGNLITDDDKMADGINQIISSISLISDTILRNRYLKKLSALTDTREGVILDKYKSLKVKPEKSEESNPHFNGIDEAKEVISEDNDYLEITTNQEAFTDAVDSKPIVHAVGVPVDSDIQALRNISSNIKMIAPDESVTKNKENDDIDILKAIYRQGYQVVIECGDKTEDFISWYIGIYASLCNPKDGEPATELEKDEYIDRVAEMIAFAPQTKRVRGMSEWASALGISNKALTDTVKLTLDKTTHKSKSYDDIDNQFDFKDDSSVVPEYIRNSDEFKDMPEMFHFYPRFNSKDEPVCYMFRSGDSLVYHRVCDFYIEPLIHIYDKDRNENKRICKLYSMRSDSFTGKPIKPRYVEWLTDTFQSVQEIKKALKLEGPYNMVNVTQKGGEWDKIEEYLSTHLKEAVRLKTLGQQKEGFFAWSNAIFAPMKKEEGRFPKPTDEKNETFGDYEIMKLDNLGLISFKDRIFYCPAFSEIYKYDRTDDDQFEQDKWLFFQDVPTNKRITFKYWARLFNEVYKINNNGKWGLLFIFLSAFRSDIFPLTGKFTALFFTGQTSSGKSQIGESIRAPWIKTGQKISNLNQISEAAFFSILERFRDIPWIFDEYNDKTLSEEKFQGLKALIYDGNTKQKRRSATGTDIVSTKVNTSIVLLGQEAPQRDDNALANRVILCDVPSHTFNRKEVDLFNELKGYERQGMSYLLCEILQIRPIVQEKFIVYQRACKDELTDKIAVTGGRAGDQTRIIETVSYFCAICKLIEEECKWLAMPFKYSEFFELAVMKVQNQVELLSHTDKVSTFFSIMDGLIDRKVIIYGREYKIEEPKEKILHLDAGDKVIPERMRLLYLNVKAVFDLYQKDKSAGEPITKQTLTGYLKSNPAYMGTLKNTRFKWKQPEYEGVIDSRVTSDDTDARAQLTMKDGEKVTSCFIFDYDRLARDMEIDLVRNFKKKDEENIPF